MQTTIKIGDLLTTPEKYIVHQCNCVSKGAAGLAKKIFTAFPYADCYSDRDTPSEMGTISICGNGLDQRFVINLFGQYSPGLACYFGDTSENRKEAFQKALDSIAKIPDLESIAFPYGIGCGLAGGDWKKYEVMIIDFAEKVSASVYIVVLQ
jgi:O-acetyl-ADP-ribose deacetylase (regulator of RNase III)